MLDNMRFGAFVTELRKEKNMTQKDLADLLHVTDKAVSKWETGKGFPDVKLMEPLAEVLGVSLVELLQGERQTSDTMTVEEAGNVAVRAMEQWERSAALKYLRLFRWLLTVIGAWCALQVVPYLTRVAHRLRVELMSGGSQNIIGGADGPTTILVGTATMKPLWIEIGIPAVMMAAVFLLAVRVWKLERTLR